MRSVSDDLTARARIRDAAIARFGRDGFDGVSLRTIASDAGVSAALIVHHFGDKAALRTACDEHVAAIFTDEKQEFIDAPTADRIRTAMADLARYGPFIDYLGRMLVDGSPASDELFDAILRGTRALLDEQRAAGLLEPMSDPSTTALLIALMGLAPVVMRAQITRTLGEDPLSPEGLQRATLPMMELMTHGLYATEAFLEGTRAAMGAAPSPGTEETG
ncbi:TetR family transcriptional regulator [Microbacterium pseudoresistens]|uniref:AcrR family transcriptional regulator n=1 Tax=Microbacterium pseudoresistens TaxID=640634 RepID=A0A7Y9EVM4_9MICO|nr:TetR family transcriptional regulator [Microbacterium pseudoresistens]NYD53915.1 AcrR family transcriptional regulator [Microbacterium pseudoresistens]